MPIRNQNWYDLNESRPFPVDDTATGMSDAGSRLPSDLIADLQLRFRDSAGRRAWFGAVTNTPSIVTVTILATDEALTAGSFMPLATISLPKPVVARRPYALDAQYPGAGGWIVFGEEIDDMI